MGRSMKIVSVEGLDKSGKHSTVEGLKEKLEAKGYKVATSEFHRYDTPTGQLIRQWLYGEYKVSQQTIELIMAADKYAQKEWFEQLEQEGYDILILDRYLGSQVVYSAASGIQPDWIQNILRSLYIPDIEIFIDISPDTSMKRKGKHGENDRYESDKELLTRARAGFMKERFYHRYKDYGGCIFGVVSGEGTVQESIEDAYQFIMNHLAE